MSYQRKTKIVATLGPACSSKEVIKKMITLIVISSNDKKGRAKSYYKGYYCYKYVFSCHLTFIFFATDLKDFHRF